MNTQFDRILLVLVLITLFTQWSHSQEKKIIPPSPEVAQLINYEQTKISPYSGIPKTSINLFELKQGDLIIPIDINYLSGGVKVEEVSTWIGLGWSSNFGGGVITRTVRGKDDFLSNHYFENVNRFIQEAGASDFGTKLAINSSNNIVQTNLLDEYMSQGKDTEPDEFYFSCGNHSGKFIMFPSGKFETIPKSNTKIESEISRNRWVITTDDGTRYVFGRTLNGSRNAYEYTDTWNVPFGGENISSWYLVEVLPVNGNLISFEYVSDKYAFRTVPKQTITHTVGSGGAINVEESKEDNFNYVNGLKLSKIDADNFSVLFESIADRKDLGGARRLSSISLISKPSGSIVKKINFSQSYFGIPDAPFSNQFEKEEICRLKLDLISAENVAEGKKIRLYDFHYDVSKSFPSRLSTSVDYWGFYNGKNNQLNYIPNGYYFNGRNYTYRTNLADKSVDENYAKTGILTKIVNPTGGSQIFEFESNKVDTIISPEFFLNQPDFGLVQQVVEKSVTASINGYGDISNEIEFQYNPFLQNPQNGTSYVEASYTSQNSIYDQTEVQCICMCFQGKITGIDNNLRYEFMLPATGNIRIENILVPGKKYKLSFYKKEGYCNGALARILVTLKWKGVEDNIVDRPKRTIVGGLRIKQYTELDNDGKISHRKQYFYTNKNNPTKSSGSVVTPQIHTHKLRSRIDKTVYGASVPVTELQQKSIFQYSNSSYYPLQTTDGGYVGYSDVEIKTINTKDINDYQLERFSYTSPKDFQDTYFDDTKLYSPSFLGSLPITSSSPPVDSKEWMRGKVVNHEILKKAANGNLNTIESTQFVYEMVIDKTVKGMSYYNFAYDKFDPLFVFKAYLYNFYQYSAGNFLLKKEVKTNYETPSYPLTITKEYNYHPQNLDYITEVNTRDSQGKLKLLRYKYVYDFLSGTNQIPIANILLSKNFVNKSLRDEVLINEKTLKVIDYTYDIFNNQYLKLKSISQKDGSNLETNRNDFLQYDSYGNPLAVKKTDGPVISYLWGYNGQYPVAEIVNAHYNDVVSAIGGQSVVDALNSGTVTADYIRQKMEILRSNLPGSQVTSYTYKPLVGMTSKTDAKGQTEYYQYDGLQRLQHVLDQFQQLRQSYHYHYRPQ
ncbi:hypothetical protein ACR79T_05625 [Sphingobacterium spiritivorum]|uniref:hypothetical protein n=1 Tax=Sphingobacterium spiritivorum TaxID=258 RepID=UPI003DA41F21